MPDKKACVIGWPIKHSRSPLIHNYWLKLHGIDAVYERCAVEPQNVVDFLRSMSPEGIVGCNVTVPHKETVYQHVIIEDDLAMRLQAVNTVYFKDGSLYGTNTDGMGFIENLKAGSPDWSPTGGPACILGAGGAARAVIAALLAEGVPEIRLTNRTRERADALKDMFGKQLSVIDWEERHASLSDCTLLVNTTSLGMTGAAPLDISLDRLPVSATVNDIVYAPLETDLLAQARERGNIAVDGLGMLLHQAVPGFALWFGVTPEVTSELRSLIIADLEA